MGKSKKVGEFYFNLNNGGWSVGLDGDDGREVKL
jgi:hypothetical protein